MEEHNHARRHIVGERIWLEYFNRYALAEGAINEQEFRAMQSGILRREAEQKQKHHIRGG